MLNQFTDAYIHKPLRGDGLTLFDSFKSRDLTAMGLLPDK